MKQIVGFAIALVLSGCTTKADWDRVERGYQRQIGIAQEHLNECAVDPTCSSNQMTLATMEYVEARHDLDRFEAKRQMAYAQTMNSLNDIDHASDRMVDRMTQPIPEPERMVGYTYH